MLISFYLPNENDRPLQDEPEEAVVLDAVVDGAPTAVHDPAGHEGGNYGADCQAEQAHNDLVSLLLRGQPMVGLAFPLLSPVAHPHVVFELQLIGN